MRGEALPFTCCITGAPEHAVQVLDLLLGCDSGCLWLKALRVAEGTCALFYCLLFWKLQGESPKLTECKQPRLTSTAGVPPPEGPFST